nr:DUF4328 domain-containing protein [Mycobacterium lepromatosis]
MCSQCGTRWNVRERRREWCLGCRGALMVPQAEKPTAVQWRGWNIGLPAGTAPEVLGWQRTPPGFRWIAVRPGAAPPNRRRRRHHIPTPRYAVMPRWGLADRVDQVPTGVQAPLKPVPSLAKVRTTLFVSMLVFVLAALVYVVRYVLLIINRNALLNFWVAATVDWLGVVASLFAIAAELACVVVLTRWLIARRAAAYVHHAVPEQRSTRELMAGCLLPLANLLLAPVYVIELALMENYYPQLQKPIFVWWIVWAFSYAISIVAVITSWAKDAQGIANNTVAMVFAYMFAAASLAAVARVFEGFDCKPIKRPAHRWVLVDLDCSVVHPSADPVELEGQEPAA